MKLWDIITSFLSSFLIFIIVMIPFEVVFILVSTGSTYSIILHNVMVLVFIICSVLSFFLFLPPRESKRISARCHSVSSETLSVSCPRKSNCFSKSATALKAIERKLKSSDERFHSRWKQRREKYSFNEKS
ncbi:MAG: hypothetical protein ACFFD4_12915 [Candidatus Odinarchaeota archaeon]